MCDVVYALAVDRLREEWLASYAAQQAWGGEVMSWEASHAALDAALVEPVKAIDPQRETLLRALGLRS